MASHVLLDWPMNALMALGALLGIAIGLMWWLSLHAEEGWEDETGFHRGAETDHQMRG